MNDRSGEHNCYEILVAVTVQKVHYLYDGLLTRSKGKLIFRRVINGSLDDRKQ